MGGLRIILVLTLVALLITVASAGEPRCSKFDYEEKTLEKMIRLDIKCEAILADVKDVKERLQEELETMKADTARAAQEVEAALAEMKMQTEKMKDEMQTAMEGLNPTVVSFKARMTDTVNVKRGSTLVFQDVVSNDGNGYDVAKGLFQAPVGGVYLFTLQLCIQNQQNLVVETVIDDIAVSRFLMYDQVRSTCYDHTDLVTLAANSSIVYTSGAPSSKIVSIMVDSLQRTNFIAGVLVVRQ